MKTTVFAAAAAALLLGTAGAMAADPIKIGFISTFSGPSGQLGQELLDGFKLGIKSTGSTLGGRPVEVVQGDDQAKPDVGRQLSDKMIESDRVEIITGINFSNVMLAVAKPVLDSGAFVFSVNAGPSQYAGKLCNPHYFNASFQNDTLPEAMGIYLRENNVKRVYLMAPNYPAGKDFLAGFKRTFKGEIAGEVYTAFGQLDYAAEIAQLRAAKPDAVFFFYPGGMGINFVKQYAQAGLKDQIKLYGPSFSLDQTVLPGMGDAAIGAFASTFWTEDFDNATSKKFVADFEAAYGRVPSPNAANAYDGARLLDAALKTIGGKIEDKAAFQKALETVKFDSVRGNFKFNTNHHPIQDSYLAEIVKDAKGRPGMKRLELIKADQADSYVGECAMK
ncbi:ABC transporter substrate-binding protein [Bradyrhizobium sp. U87765 SZCCT0131]|uniref:ABC transporter substrate-binding protein n=1 Tax=unclassified Bradyrhizobium TaxID=2631580 RepID=UPI001BAD296E|nr:MULTISPECIES: ABC transporter substrate-binding protein [unclassified Bradyrhizobium]MBR1221364.1 ABC transporter substrate-binding protein [Bradyrhizobium sp. U87765 SZCCT0131]MBR1264713.1 ABC transporter substrate-binding protein [Bradyrhizobium sp. U87765 SZCCT0134]MBR1304381.1 ABC transporter substrate-binding protein [Bradyrhizobium sp. U87765 SZCCT0110]MBR1322762.1 ABC transporter substrate-binding protein [Bradyrhizobium sp. U87765 SZCCT0109]MBR1346310.1 ABC transporter substrate-bin